MRKNYKKAAYLLDEDILFFGYKDKYGFHPERNLQCGFNIQKVSKRNIGKTLFYGIKDAIDKLGEVKVCGGTFYIAIDAGLAQTKMALGDKCGSVFWYTTSTLYDNTNESLEKLFNEFYASINIISLTDVDVKSKIIDTPYINYKAAMIFDEGFGATDFVHIKNKEYLKDDKRRIFINGLEWESRRL